MSGPIRYTLDEIIAILGEPPLLSTEDRGAYYAMLAHYMTALNPRDFVLQMLVKDLVDADWEGLRFKRLKALGVDRRDRLAREIEAHNNAIIERRKLAAEGKSKTDGQKGVELVDGVTKPARDLSLGMEKALDYYERIDRMEKDSVAKRVIILEQIRIYDELLYLRIKRLNELEHQKLVIARNNEIVMSMLRQEAEKEKQEEEEKERGEGNARQAEK